MDVYLPIANLSVNAALIIALGFLVGVLSGMFGVGGGFLTTPILIFYGIPPTVAVASATTQITGSSVSGAMVHVRRGGVDFKMAGMMIVGGLFGSVVGAILFRLLQKSGQIDVVIGALYVLILGWIGILMLRDAIRTLGLVDKYFPGKLEVLGGDSVTADAVEGETDSAQPAEGKPGVSQRLLQRLPLRWRFETSGLFISPIAPVALGFIAGILTVFLGIGGGFILIPAMIYILGMPARVVVGSSLIMILAVSAATTMIHALTTRAVDIVLAVLLLAGGVIGAQYGAQLATRIKPDFLRLALALIILVVAIRMLLGLAWQPDEIFSVEII